MRHVITSHSEFQQVLDALSSATLTSARMPARVFQLRYDRFRFLEFDLFPSPEFWAMLQRLLEDSHDSKLNVLVLEPDPKNFFYAEFGHFGALQIPANASADVYRGELQSSPQSEPANCLEVLSRVLVWFPPSLRWLIWGERDLEIMVLACVLGFGGPSDSSLEKTGMCLFTPEDALEISSPAWRDRIARPRFAQELMSNYGGGRSWVDDAPQRAIALARKVLAGELGVIEGCRALSSMRWECGASLAERFSPFVVAESETDDLPVGAVRNLWDAEALTRKDPEIGRCEQLYRAQTLEACKNLIGRLTIAPHRQKT
jgi:hypothetical protein